MKEESTLSLNKDVLVSRCISDKTTTHSSCHVLGEYNTTSIGIHNFVPEWDEDYG